MPTISYKTPNKLNGQTANTVVLAGSALPANTSMAISATANGSPVAIAVAITTTAQGTVSQTISITSTALQSVLSMLGGGSWNDIGANWSCGASSSSQSITLAFSVA